uniref:Uncharacterized protein n=1 Tax=mine drainage metagenome TaxID=410659 RepID=E6Q6W7_9ZZZZ
MPTDNRVGIARRTGPLDAHRRIAILGDSNQGFNGGRKGRFVAAKRPYVISPTRRHGATPSPFCEMRSVLTALGSHYNAVSYDRNELSKWPKPAVRHFSAYRNEVEFLLHTHWDRKPTASGTVTKFA